MRIDDAESAFRAFAKKRGNAIESLSASDAVATMLDFYRLVRCSDAAPRRGDAL